MEPANISSASASCQPVVIESISDDPEAFKLIWTINNYSGLENRSGVVKSDVVQAGSKSNHKWQISVYPKRRHKGTDYLGYQLDLVDYGNKPASGKVFTKSCISFVYANGQQTFPWGHRTDLRWKGKSTQWYLATFATTITDPQFNLLNNDALTIQLQVELEPYEVPDPGTVPIRPPKVNHRKILETVKILRKSVPGDVTIKAANKEFKAHEELLKVVCPAMLGGIESGEALELPIVDASAFEDDVVEGLLNYVYEGQTGLLKTPGKAIGLLQMAKKYELEDLRKECETAVKDNFKPTVDTVLNDLLVAHSAGMEDLTNTCLEFFHKKSKAVRLSTSYRKHVESSQIETIFDLYADYVAPKISS